MLLLIRQLSGRSRSGPTFLSEEEAFSKGNTPNVLIQNYAFINFKNHNNRKTLYISNKNCLLLFIDEMSTSCEK